MFLFFFVWLLRVKLDDFRLEIQRRDQEIMAMAAKMKTLEEQHQVSVICLLCSSEGDIDDVDFLIQPGLPTSYISIERIIMRQRGALHNAAGRCGRAAYPLGGEKSFAGEKGAGRYERCPRSQSHHQRIDRAEGSHGHQGPQDQCSAEKGSLILNYLYTKLHNWVERCDCIVIFTYSWCWLSYILSIFYALCLKVVRVKRQKHYNVNVSRMNFGE